MRYCQGRECGNSIVWWLCEGIWSFLVELVSMYGVSGKGHIGKLVLFFLIDKWASWGDELIRVF